MKLEQAMQTAQAICTAIFEQLPDKEEYSFRCDIIGNNMEYSFVNFLSYEVEVVVQVVPEELMHNSSSIEPQEYKVVTADRR